MFCPKCGEKTEIENSNYCYNCGTELSKIRQNLPDETLQENNKGNNAEAVSSKDVVDDGKNKVDTEQKNKGSQNKDNNINNSKPSTYRLHSSNSLEISWWDKFKERWGWGWLFFAYEFYSPQANKDFNNIGEYGGILSIFGFAASMFLYFIFRQKYLVKIKVDWIRSSLSVIITYTIVLLALILINVLFSYTINKSNLHPGQLQRYTLPDAHLNIESPSAFIQGTNKITNEYNNSVKYYYNYSNDNKFTSLTISIHYTEFQENLTFDLDKVADGYNNYMKQATGITDFQCSSLDYNIDGHLGKIVTGTLKMNDKDTEFLAGLLFQNSRLWQVICLYPTTDENRVVAKQVINSIIIEN
ncbi:MAG: zinc ribbon domain-containing protein [Ignavibacteriaceae bacterium]